MPEEPKDSAVTAVCPYCDTENVLSGRFLFNAVRRAKIEKKPVRLPCLKCAKVSTLPLDDMPDPGKKLNPDPWIVALKEETDNWLPCVVWEGPERPLPVGEYIPPGANDTDYKLILYKPGTLKKSPSGDSWWTYYEYIDEYGIDPWIARNNMEKLMRKRPPVVHVGL